MATHISNLDASARHEFGKGASRRLRRAGRIPAVIYGNELDEPIHISVDSIEFHAVLRNHGSNAVVDIDVEGDKHLTMVKAVDQNVLTLDADHADLLAIRRGETVEVEVPVVTEGTVAPGGMLMQDVDVINVESDVLSIPEEITVSVEGLAVGDQITAGDIRMPANTTLVSDPDTLIVNVVVPEVADTESDNEDNAEAEGESTEAESESNAE
ncbi:50S ribosomal protein L25/general stress protein Ctc [Corynebacterium kroppenstedtii]|uniref:50S ribosomal protein L25/general stress protein Ctc n=1 Tax=Corynebacterium sp. PCR 32 TaxID=3351342 RepID=UPI0030A69976